MQKVKGMTERNRLLSLYNEHLNVSTDTRNINEGAIFFALKGPRFNANGLALEALKKGASYAVIDEPEYNTDSRCIVVEDVLESLQQLAFDYRKQWDLPVLALTGSNGKTTTKELLMATLSQKYKVLATKGNLNNHIGVPLTLLRLRPSHEIAIIEMGANHQGEIRDLCSIAQPTHGLITNIGRAHLEGFGGEEGVKKGKGELYDYLAQNDGIAFYNAADPTLSQMVERVSHRIAYSPWDKEKGEYGAMLIASSPYVKFAFLDDDQIETQVQTQMIGQYNFNNMLSAIAVGRYFKVSSKQIVEALCTYQSDNNRSQQKRALGNDFILDAYNANPDSMRSSIDSFLQMNTDQSPMLILGEMKELGDFSEQAHLDLVAFIKAIDPDVEIITVGLEFESAASENGLMYFDQVDNLKQWFQKEKIANRSILLKGSRSVGLERLLH